MRMKFLFDLWKDFCEKIVYGIYIPRIIPTLLNYQNHLLNNLLTSLSVLNFYNWPFSINFRFLVQEES